MDDGDSRVGRTSQPQLGNMQPTDRGEEGGNVASGAVASQAKQEGSIVGRRGTNKLHLVTLTGILTSLSNTPL